MLRLAVTVVLFRPSSGIDSNYDYADAISACSNAQGFAALLMLCQHVQNAINFNQGGGRASCMCMLGRISFTLLAGQISKRTIPVQT